MSLSPAKQKFVDLAAAKYGEGATLAMSDVTSIREEHGLGWPSWFVRPPYRVGRGKFKLPVEGESITPIISKPIVRESVVEETQAVMAYHNLPKVWSLVKTHCMCRLAISMTFTVS